MGEQPVPAALQQPVPDPAMVEPDEESIPSVAGKRILRWHEKAYQKLLTLDQTGRAARFPIGELRAALRNIGYMSRTQINSLSATLKKHGLVVVSDEMSGKSTSGHVAYVYRVTGYQVVDRTRGRRSIAAEDAAADHDSAAPADRTVRKTRPSRQGDLGIIGVITRFFEELEAHVRPGEKLDCAIAVRGGKITCSVKGAGDTIQIVRKAR